MKQAVRIALIQFKMMVKAKGSLALMFIMPLAMTLIFGTMAGAGGGTSGDPIAPIAVVNGDSSFAAAKLVEGLQAEPALKVTVIPANELDLLLSQKSTYAGIVIPAGYGRSLDTAAPLDIKIVTLPGSSGTNMYVAPVIGRVVAHTAGDYRLAQQVAGPGADEAKVTSAYQTVTTDRASSEIKVERQPLYGQKAGKSNSDFSAGGASLGFTVMFVMMIVFMMTSSILSERESGTWGRLLTTPVTRLAVLIGFLLSFYITGLFQFAVLVVTTSLFFHTNWGPLLPLLAMSTLFIFCSAAMGLFLAGLVKTADQQKSIGMLVVISTSMLGGVYWPLELMNPTMQRIGYMTPQAWAMAGFREVMLRGGSWDGLITPFIVLASLTVIFMTAGLFRIRYE